MIIDQYKLKKIEIENEKNKDAFHDAKPASC